jgi:hypothetical protein
VFAIGYTLLAISSRRFLVPGIAMFVIAGAIAALDRKWLAIALTLLPPLAYDVYAFTHPEPPDNPAPFVVASEIRPLPPGRVLAPWYLGHAIDVFGRHAVVIDNFGSMPDARRFEIANDALTNRHHDQVLDYCRRNGVRYLANDRAPSWHGFPQIAPHVWLCSAGEIAPRGADETSAQRLQANTSERGSFQLGRISSISIASATVVAPEARWIRTLDVRGSTMTTARTPARSQPRVFSSISL